MNLYKIIQNWRLNKVRKAIEKIDDKITENYSSMKLNREMCSTHYMNKDVVLSNKFLRLKDKESKLLGYSR